MRDSTGGGVRSLTAAVAVAWAAAVAAALAASVGVVGWRAVWFGAPLLGAGVSGSDLDHVRRQVERLAAGEYDLDLDADDDTALGRLAEAVEAAAAAAREREATRTDLRERLAAERDRRTALVENTTDCIVHVELGEDVVIRAVNSRFEAVFGYDAEDVVGESLVDLVVPDGRLDEVAEIRRHISAGEPVERELRRETATGTADFLFRFVPVVPDDGSEPTEGYAVYTDISDRKQREREMRAAEEHRRALYDITSDTDLTSSEKVDRLLELGCDWFGVDNAVVSRVDETTGEYYIERSVGDDFPGAGTELPLSVTYCRRTIATDDILGIFNAIEEGLADDPGYAESGIACYIGGRIEVDDELYGTLCYFDDEPVEEPFTQSERALVDLMARWVSHVFERREKEAELRLKDRAMEAAPVGITISDADEPDNPIVYTNPAFERITGYDEETVAGRNHRFLQGEGTADIPVAKLRRAIDAHEPVSVELRNYRADGTEFWNRVRVAPVADGCGEPSHYVGFQEDVTARKERELALESLHETSRKLLRAESPAEAAEVVVDAAAAVLDVSGVAVYRFDTSVNRLEPLAYSDGFAGRGGGDPPSIGADEGQVWNAFVAGNRTVVDAAGTDGPLAGVGTALVVPMGDHGAFVATADTEPVPDRTRRLVETVSATAAAAFDRLASEADLRERESELAARNERLERQIAVNELSRRIDRSLVAAESREAVETTVCERLVATDDVAFAWVGAPEDGRVQPRAWAGGAESYLDEVAPETGGAEPAAEAAETGRAVLVENVAEEMGGPDWPEAALADGLQSVLAIPLSVDGYDYGVLTLYGPDPGTFGDLERSVFAELGTTIANFVNAVETRRALRADVCRELTLRVDGADDLLARLAAELDWTVEYEDAGTRDGEETSLFVRVTDADDIDALSEFVSVADYQVVAETGDGWLLEVTVAGGTLVDQCIRHGATPRRIETTDDGLEAVVDLPEPRDVRAFVELLREHHPSVELVRKREVERPADSRAGLAEPLLERLTDRQQEVLRTAYHAGYFEWPRENSGEEVGELLGISQPAVNRHLRRALAGLLDGVFEAGER